MRRTLAQEAARADAADKQSTVLHCALNDCLRGAVRWFKTKDYSLGICRPLSPTGGIVVVSYHPADQAPQFNAYYWEDWWPNLRDCPPAPTNAEGQALFNLAIKAQQYVASTQNGGTE